VPPKDAAKIESVQVPAGPSEEATKEALERARDMEQKADTRYDATMQRRQQEAEARAKEEARAAEQARRAAESADETAAESNDYIWYQGSWHWPYPPRPPTALRGAEPQLPKSSNDRALDN
jgi:hypothetical protein